MKRSVIDIPNSKINKKSSQRKILDVEIKESLKLEKMKSDEAIGEAYGFNLVED